MFRLAGESLLLNLKNPQIKLAKKIMVNKILRSPRAVLSVDIRLL